MLPTIKGQLNSLVVCYHTCVEPHLRSSFDYDYFRSIRYFGDQLEKFWFFWLKAWRVSPHVDIFKDNILLGNDGTEYGMPKVGWVLFG